MDLDAKDTYPISATEIKSAMKILEDFSAIKDKLKPGQEKNIATALVKSLGKDAAKVFIEDFLKYTDTIRAVYRLFYDTPKTDKQTELFPVFVPQQTVEIKKEFALNFGNIEKIEKEYTSLLSKKLISGKTLQQHLDEVKHWFDNLHGSDLGNWIKLFGFVKSVRDHAEEYKDTVNLREISKNRFLFEVNANKAFYNFFILPDKKMGRHTTKAKEKLHRWFYENQKSITFPMIVNGEVWAAPLQIFSLAEAVSDTGKRRFVFMVDTNILDSRFENFVRINTKEVDLIAEAWERIADENPDFAKYELSDFQDLPLKFLLTLTLIYNPEGDFQNGAYYGNTQRLTDKNLDARLGGLWTRIQNHVKSNHISRAKDGGQTVRAIAGLLLKTIFGIARERKWLMSDPIYEEGVYTFNLNPGYFASQRTAKKIRSGTC
jgi:DNA-binding transcriptional regulator GbsR (MarR family)